MRFTFALFVGLTILTSGCGPLIGASALIARDKYECESQGKFWDLEKGCIDQEESEGEGNNDSA